MNAARARPTSVSWPAIQPPSLRPSPECMSQSPESIVTARRPTLALTRRAVST